MKLRTLIICLAALAVGYLVYLAFSLASLPPVEQLRDRRANLSIRVRDWKGNEHPFVVGPRNRYWAPGSAIPSEMKWAVILAEDSNFYRHEGVDVKAIREAIRHDLEKKSLARGASTITQQTAKNLFLTREKTLTRKAKELVLAMRMERELTKGRILELYLNVVELGPMVYGVGHASRYYFGKEPAALTPRECAFLAAMLPGPRVAYNPYRNVQKVLKRSDMILGLLKNRGVLSPEEYRRAMDEVPNIAGLQRKVDQTVARVEPVLDRFSTAAEPAPAAGAHGEPPAGEGPHRQQMQETKGAAPGAPPQEEKQ
ncbi:MAG TPA: biosynthetic peptidoglycan transglycosylase [Verrucomicrobiae bacterium]|nr:biosynthetic peptidoglycan transglycosylase [Verrucomicrobiae bacterium]